MTNAHEQTAKEPQTMTDSRINTMPNWLRYLLIALCGLLAISTVGYLAGFTLAALQNGTFLTQRSGLLLTAGIVIVTAASWGLYQLVKATSHEVVAPRIRKNRQIYWISGAIGGLLGLMLSFGVVDPERFDLYSNGPLDRIPAIIAIAVWCTAIPVLCWVWLRNIDEHEARANGDGAVTGILAYFIIAPAWWVGWRAGLFIEPQEMITFLLVLVIYSAVWMWRRYG